MPPPTTNIIIVPDPDLRSSRRTAGQCTIRITRTFTLRRLHRKLTRAYRHGRPIELHVYIDGMPRGMRDFVELKRILDSHREITKKILGAHGDAHQVLCGASIASGRAPVPTAGETRGN